MQKLIAAMVCWHVMRVHLLTSTSPGGFDRPVVWARPQQCARAFASHANSLRGSPDPPKVGT